MDFSLWFSYYAIMVGDNLGASTLQMHLKMEYLGLHSSIYDHGTHRELCYQIDNRRFYFK